MANILPVHQILDRAPDFLQTARESYQYGVKQADQSALRKLAPGVVAGDPAAYAQAAAIDPAAAQAQQGAGDANFRRLGGAVKLVDDALKTGNMQAVNAAMTHVAPFMSQVLGKPIPPVWDEAGRPAFEQLKARIAMASVLPVTGTPQDVRSFEMMTAGLTPEEKEKARKVELGLEGRKSGAAIQYKTQTLSDGTKVLVAVDPREVGAHTIGSGMTYGSGVGMPGVHATATPTASTPQTATAVNGGSRFSTNIANIPADVQQKWAKIGAAMLAAGATDQQVDDYILSQLPNAVESPVMEADPVMDNGGLRPVGNNIATPSVIAGGGNPFASRPEEVQKALSAEAEAAAKLRVEQSGYPAAAQQAGDVEAAKSNAKFGAELQQTEPQRKEKVRLVTAGIDNTIKNIDRSINAVDWTTAGLPGVALSVVPGTPAYDLDRTAISVKANLGFDRLQQMRDASPTGGALGQVAVQELTALQAALASLDQGQSPSQLRENLTQVKQHYQGWKEAVLKADTAAQQRLQGAGSGPGQRRLRYNPATGRLE